METEFGSQIVHWENHCSDTDPFTTTETTTRANWYGVTGYPTVQIDGISQFVGADVCPNQTVTYRDGLNARIAATDGCSPVVINSSMTINAGVASMSATFKLVDPVQLSNLRGTLLLYEDDLTWCCGYGGVSHWDRVTRKIYDQNVTLTNVGDQVTISTNVSIGAWVPANLVGIAYLQSTTHQGGPSGAEDRRGPGPGLLALLSSEGQVGSGRERHGRIHGPALEPLDLEPDLHPRAGRGLWRLDDRLPGLRRPESAHGAHPGDASRRTRPVNSPFAFTRTGRSRSGRAGSTSRRIRLAGSRRSRCGCSTGATLST